MASPVTRSEARALRAAGEPEPLVEPTPEPAKRRGVLGSARKLRLVGFEARRVALEHLS